MEFFGRFDIKLNYPIIKNWAFITMDDNPYLAPELSPVRLYGKIFDSEKFEDGESSREKAINFFEKVLEMLKKEKGR